MVTAAPINPDRLDQLLDKVDALAKEVRALHDHQRRQDELIEELTPIVKLMIESGSRRLGTLEERGHFARAEALLAALDEAASAVAPDDVRRLGTTVARSLSALSHPEAATPMTLRKLLQGSRDPELQRGLGVLTTVLRVLGGSAGTLSAPTGRQARLAALLGPSKPRAALPAPAPRPAPLPVAPRPTPAKVAFSVPGLPLGADGFFTDAGQWSEDAAKKVATALGYAELTDAHWTVIRWARADFDSTKKSPNVRRLGGAVGGRVKELYTLFPNTPGMSVARIAGLPKPVGCI